MRDDHSQHFIHIARSVKALTSLRREIEEGSNYPHSRLNAAFLLADVCQALGLSHRQTAYVMGENAYRYWSACTEEPAPRPKSARNSSK